MMQNNTNGACKMAEEPAVLSIKERLVGINDRLYCLDDLSNAINAKLYGPTPVNPIKCKSADGPSIINIVDDIAIMLEELQKTLVGINNKL